MKKHYTNKEMIAILERYFNQERTNPTTRLRIKKDTDSMINFNPQELIQGANASDIEFIQLVLFYNTKYDNSTLFILDQLNAKNEELGGNASLAEANLRLENRVKAFLQVKNNPDKKRFNSAIKRIYSVMNDALVRLFKKVNPQIETHIRRSMANTMNGRDRAISLSSKASVRTVKLK